MITTNLTSIAVASIIRKLLKILKNVAFIQIEKVAIYDSDRKKSIKYKENHADSTTYSHQLFFDANWYIYRQ